MNKKILVFTENKVGEGHYQAANAIKAMINEKYKEKADVKLVSGMKAIHPILEWLLVTCYFCLIRVAPYCWKVLYTKTSRASFLQRHVFRLRLRKLLEDEKPDIILFTHVTCVPAICEMKKREHHTFKTGVIFTDFGFHPFFIHSEIDFYFVAHEKIREQLVLKFGIHSSRVYDYGIPVHPSFDQEDQSPNVIPLKKRKKFHILVLGGATGFGPIEKLLKIMRSQSIPYHITVITGKNQKLYQKLQRKNYPSTVVLGYVTDMKFWMKQADIIITKPGGLTLSEAIMCGTPIVTVKPIPGHEEFNQQFLHEHQVTVPVKELHQIPFYIRQWLYKPEELEEWRDRIKQFQKRNSAYRIVQTLLEQA